MTIKFYRNWSDTRLVSKNIEEATTLNGTLRNRCSVTDPVFAVESADPPTVNYMYVPEFNRYYYITSIESINNGLWSISGHVDVLMSYANQIRAQKAVIARQQYKYNLYLDDDRLLVTCKRSFSTKAFPNTLPTGGKQICLILAGSPNG